MALRDKQCIDYLTILKIMKVLTVNIAEECVNKKEVRSVSIHIDTTTTQQLAIRNDST